jgi:type I restriction enzyme M protein
MSAGNTSTASVTTTPQQLARIAGFIWGIADDVLRDLYVRGKYRDVILPMTVLRRFDAVLEPTKQAVLDMKRFLDEQKIVDQDGPLRDAAGQAVYNTSKFTLRDLRSRTSQQQLRLDFEAYLDGFSPNVQEILDAFEFRNQIPRLSRADAIGTLIERFLDPSIDLTPAGLDNHAMGTVFEDLVRQFNEANNEEAGEHWTPRDAVRLMASLVFLPIADAIESGTYLIYDGACGTGGMLTVAESTLLDLARKHDKTVSIHLYGQEINSETHAIAKADLLLKGEGEAADNIVGGPEHSTLSNDAFPSREFDFMLSNPPYGKSWKSDLERMGGKGGMKDPRFMVQHNGDPEFSLVTRSSDGQLLFLANLVSKMKHETPLGSRIAEVHNGSSLFTGDAGQGESNIRRWIIENDWLEAIVALPLNMFYNTGIATYVWVLANRKPEHRRGQVQLIDATKWFVPLRKNLGKKNSELSAADIERICEAHRSFEETEESKVFPNEHFGYRKVTVDRPLRLHAQWSLKAVESLRFASGEPAARRVIYDEIGDAVFDNFNSVRDRVTELLSAATSDDISGRFASLRVSEKARKKLLDERTWERDGRLVEVARALREAMRDELYPNFNDFVSQVEATIRSLGIKLSTADKKHVLRAPAWREEDAAPVIRRIHKRGEPDPLHGRVETSVDGKTVVVEYEPDPDLRDTEQVPLLEEGGVDAFLEREVLPHAPDAWYDPATVKVGFEISFTREFYKPQPLRSLEEIRSDILALERETEGLIGEVVG